MQSDLRGRSEACEREGHYLSNAAPQKQALNNGAWKRLEMKCKKWAERYDEIRVLCGPVFDTDEPPRLQGNSKDRVAAPDRFYKVVLRETLTGPNVLAFIMDHEPWPASGTPLKTFLVSVDDVESATGLDFLADLDDTVEVVIEAEEPIEIWPD